MSNRELVLLGTVVAGLGVFAEAVVFLACLTGGVRRIPTIAFGVGTVIGIGGLGYLVWMLVTWPKLPRSVRS